MWIVRVALVAAIWNYWGLSAQDMADRIVSNYERTLTITVNDIEHIESQSLRGIAIVKVFFQPGTKIAFHRSLKRGVLVPRQ